MEKVTRTSIMFRLRHFTWYPVTDGDLPLYSRMGEEMTLSSSDEASGSEASRSRNEIAEPYDYLFTPLTPTIPEPWVEINTSHNQGSAPPSTATGMQADVLWSSTSSLPSSGLIVDDLLLSVQAEHLVDVHFGPPIHALLISNHSDSQARRRLQTHHCG
jgi:hypothetical protein